MTQTAKGAHPARKCRETRGNAACGRGLFAWNGTFADTGQQA
jgi:hypothetical protein